MVLQLQLVFRSQKEASFRQTYLNQPILSCLTEHLKNQAQRYSLLLKMKKITLSVLNSAGNKLISSKVSDFPYAHDQLLNLTVHFRHKHFVCNSNMSLYSIWSGRSAWHLHKNSISKIPANDCRVLTCLSFLPQKCRFLDIRLMQAETWI